MNDQVKARFEQEVKSHPLVIFMKGNALFPRCGFSAAALQALQKHGQVHAVDVLAEPELREAIKEYTNWPTIPQVFIHGKFVGGCDIVREMDASGELAKVIAAG